MDILSKLTLMLEGEGWGKATHPGLLEVPADKDVRQLPLKHFVKLAKKKGFGAISKGLMNLYRWHKNNDPELSAWARNMQQQLHNKMVGSKKEKEEE